MKKTRLSRKEFLDLLSEKNINIVDKNKEYLKKEKIIDSLMDKSDESGWENTDVSLEYLGLASRVKKDFSAVDKITEEESAHLAAGQEKLLRLIMKWAEAKIQFYKYYSNYLINSDPLDKNKSVELKKEAENIEEEFLKSLTEL